MTLEEIAEKLELTVQTVPEELGREVTGGYASDVLSYVLAKAQPGNLWVTLQSHPNVVAVAASLKLAGVVVSECRALPPATLEKAQREQVPLLTTPRSTFSVVAGLVGLGIAGVD